MTSFEKVTDPEADTDYAMMVLKWALGMAVAVAAFLGLSLPLGRAAAGSAKGAFDQAAGQGQLQETADAILVNRGGDS
jgi:hypothetical protein